MTTFETFDRAMEDGGFRSGYAGRRDTRGDGTGGTEPKRSHKTEYPLDLYSLQQGETPYVLFGDDSGNEMRVSFQLSDFRPNGSLPTEKLPDLSRCTLESFTRFEDHMHGGHEGNLVAMLSPVRDRIQNVHRLFTRYHVDALLQLFGNIDDVRCPFASEMDTRAIYKLTGLRSLQVFRSLDIGTLGAAITKNKATLQTLYAGPGLAMIRPACECTGLTRLHLWVNSLDEAQHLFSVRAQQLEDLVLFVWKPIRHQVPFVAANFQNLKRFGLRNNEISAAFLQNIRDKSPQLQSVHLQSVYHGGEYHGSIFLSGYHASLEFAHDVTRRLRGVGVKGLSVYLTVTGPGWLSIVERDNAIIEGVVVSHDAFESTRENAILLKDIINRTKHIRWSIENTELEKMVRSEMIAEFMPVDGVPEIAEEFERSGFWSMD